MPNKKYKVVDLYEGFDMALWNSILKCGTW